jgi:tetratricopeptide (TPR) repeat protein
MKRDCFLRRLSVGLGLSLSLGSALTWHSALADQRVDAHRLELDRLFTALKAAPDEQTAGMIESRIHGLWVGEASPAAVLLMSRGERDLQGNADSEALTDFDDVLTLEPDYVEGFHHRAVARAALGDYPGALADIEQALRRDPRHFSALQTLSRLAEQQGNWKGALAAWQKALDIDPLSPGGIARLEMLQKKVDGEAT